MAVEMNARPRIVPAVRRDRLVRMLDDVPDGGVATIIAGAGSGKSMLLTSWMNAHGDVSCVAIDADPRSTDPTVFARTLVNAIDRRVDGFSGQFADLLTAGSGVPGRAFVARLVVAIEELDDALVIIVDDAHLPVVGGSLTLLDEFIAHLPENVRLFVAARWDPQLTLHRLRLAGNLVEIRGSDLAFDLAETRSLVESISGVALDDSMLKKLDQRTDGWAAGIQLAAISLRRSPDVARFVEDFSGSDVLVAQYLTREVLDSLDAATRRFIMATSVLPWLSADLCGAVVDDMNPSAIEAMLADLEQQLIFVVPAASDGCRYRYHHLFADLIRYVLRHDDPERERVLRRRAAEHLALHGDVAAAVEQYLELGDVEGVLRVVVEHGRPFYERNESATLVRWLTAAESMRAEPPPELGVQLLAAQIAALDSAAAAETYWRIGRRGNLTVGQEATCHALFCLLGFDDLPPNEIEHTSADALRLLASATDDDLVDVLGVGGRETTELFARFMLAVAAFHRGDVQDAVERFEAVLELDGMRYPVWKMYTLGYLGLVHAWRGDLPRAESLAGKAVDLARRNSLVGHVGLAYAHLALARVALDRLDLTVAAEELSLTGFAAEQSDRAALSATHRLLEGIRLTLANGPARALAELEATAPPALWPPIVANAERELRVRLRIASDNLLAARDVVADHSVGEGARFDLAFASGDLAAASAILDSWMPLPDSRRSALGLLIRRAAVLAAEGHRRDALRVLADALMRAEPGAIRGPFLEVPAAVSLLKSDVQLSSQPFAASIIAGASAVDGRDPSHDGLIDPLTDREREVLTLLPTRLTNAEMAASLYVSVNTLKTHVRHIYVKLDAIDRDHAVERAAQLGIL